MEPPPYHLERWERLVGRFILAFGEIELSTFVLWRMLGAGEPAPQNFKERTGVLLSRLRCLPDPHVNLCQLLEDCLRLADKRNAVAHHPLCVQVFEHTKTGEYVVEVAIRSETSDEYITDKELEEMGGRTRKLAEEIFKALPKS